MEKYSLARARMQLATLAIAWRSAFETSLTRFGCASDAKLLLTCSGACLLPAETQITPFRPKINCTPAANTPRMYSHYKIGGGARHLIYGDYH